jgi:hypothetical protein
MNYRRHYFLLNASGIIGVCIGGVVWFVESSIRMFSAGVAKMPVDSISWRLYVYPLLGVMAVASACVPLEGLEVEVMGIPLHGALASRVAWGVWVVLNLYLLLGIIWNLAAPDEPATAALSRSRRGLFIALGMLFVAASLLAPSLRSH